MKAPGVGGEEVHPGRLLPINSPLAVLAVGGRAAIVVGLVGVDTVAPPEGGLRPRPAGVLPLGLRRQRVPAPVQGAELLAELLAIVPGDAVHGQFLLLLVGGALEPAVVG